MRELRTRNSGGESDITGIHWLQVMPNLGELRNHLAGALKVLALELKTQYFLY